MQHRRTRPTRSMPWLLPVLAVLVGLALLSGPGAPAAQAAPHASPRAGSTVTMAGGFVPVTPHRVLDTRRRLGAGPVGPQRTIDIQVAGLGAVPASGVAAVVVTLTATAPSRSGYLTAYPTGTARPRVSTLNFVAGQTVANLATVRLSAGGRLSVYNGSAGLTEVLADVTGYYLAGTPTDAGAFAPATPSRVLDTRVGLGAPRHRLAAGGTLTLAIPGAGTPAALADPVMLNVTVVDPQAKGFLTAYAAGTARPRASNLNFTSGAVVPNLVTTAVSAAGEVSFYNGSGGDLDLVADIEGSYLSGTPTRAGAFVPITPTRFVDSRIDLVISEFVNAGTTFSAQVVNLDAAGAGHGVVIPPSNVSAVVTNLTATAVERPGFVTAYATGTPRPQVSSLSHEQAVTRANAAVVGVGSCGRISFYNGSRGFLGMVADAEGYFLAADAATPTPPVHPVVTWGYPTRGSLAGGDQAGPAVVDPVRTVNTSEVTAVTANDHALAVRSDGTVLAWGPGCAVPQPVPGLTGVSAVAAGEDSSYALKSDGTVWAWGGNRVGQLGDGTITDRPAPVPVSGLTGVTAIASGWRFALALKSDGTVWGWGEETLGELGHGLAQHTTPVQVAPATLTGVTAIGAGYLTGYAVTSGGQVRAWGGNLYGELGNGTAADGVAHPVPGLVSGVGGSGSLSGVTGLAQIVGYTPMALRADQTVVAWGRNQDGALGIGATEASQPRSLVPVAVAGLGNVTAVASGFGFASALTAAGEVWTWGATPQDAAAAVRLTPAKVTALSGVTGIAGGLDAAYAITP